MSMKLSKNNIEFVKVTFNYITRKIIVVVMLKDHTISNMRIYDCNFVETLVLPKSVHDFIKGSEPMIFDEETNIAKGMDFVTYIYK